MLDYLKMALIVLVGLAMGMAAVSLSVGAEAGGVLNYGISGRITTIDPAVCVDDYGIFVIKNTYERLVEETLDGTNVVPGLAESWTVSPDGLTYTFKLRPGVTFYDDGSPVTAEAVRFSLERALRLAKGKTWLLEGVLDPEGIRVHNDDEISINLFKPTPFLLQILASPVPASIINPRTVEANSTVDDPEGETYLYENTAGTGPFKVTEWAHGQYIVLDRNPGYWQEGLPKLNRLVLRVVTEPATASSMLQGGELDIVYRLPSDVTAYLSTRPGIRTLSQPRLEFTALYFNCMLRPVDDINVRRALSYAIDYETAMKIVGFQGQRMTGFLLSGMLGYDPNRLGYTQDLEKAKKLLSEAGYPDGFALTCQYPVWGNIPDVMVAVQADLVKVGVKLELQQIAFGPYLDLVNKGEIPLFPWEGSPPINDPHSFLFPRVSSTQIGTGSGGNVTNYANPAVDLLLEGGLAELDPAKREKIYQALDAALTSDAVAIWLWQTVAQQPVCTWVKDYVYPVLGLPNMSQVYLEK